MKKLFIYFIFLTGFNLMTAYTPPFSSSTYFSRTIDTITSSRHYVTSMNNIWKQATTQELIVPSVTVDRDGNLYVLHYAGTTNYWDYRLTKVSLANGCGTRCVSLYDYGFGTTEYHSRYTGGSISEKDNSFRHVWPNMLRPVIFRDTCSKDNYKAIVCSFPFVDYKYIATSDNKCDQGMVFAKIDPSNLVWLEGGRLRKKQKDSNIWNTLEHQSMWLNSSSCGYKGNCGTGRHNYNESIYWGLAKGFSQLILYTLKQTAIPAETNSTHSISNYTSTLNLKLFAKQEDSSAVYYMSESNFDLPQYCGATPKVYSTMLEGVQNEYYTSIDCIVVTGLTPHLCYNGSFTTFDSFRNGNTAINTAHHFAAIQDEYYSGKNYQGQAQKKDTYLVMGFVAGTGSASPYLAVLSKNNNDTGSFTKSDNMIYDTSIKCSAIENSSENKATSLKTLYKCTHKMVLYGERLGYGIKRYLIYAYCYPGRKKQCILGYAPYTIDVNGNLKLSTRMEFCDADGNTFSPLNDCSRIIDMSIYENPSNGEKHLWLTWVTADESTIKCFHIKPESFIRNIYSIR